MVKLSDLKIDRDGFGFSMAVIAQRQAPKPTREGQDGPSLDSPRLFTTRAVAGAMDMFCYSCVWRKTLPLRGSFARSSSLGSRSRSVQQDF
ncbi:hypothetical protein KWG64_01565 [Rahnella sp. PD12R]|uniref:hypothetical protein n=1 Tax=Rahnella sp. PD12R TaxID=2855688 RepID=UPI001C47F9E0|nr:hypothetical protein [Rahnella sp. PD12R]MBV6816624.1 hypothetical protein [Rahnella sp. PD12R]